MKSLFYLLRKAKLAWMSAFFCFFGATSSTKSRQGNSRVLFFLFVNVKPLFLSNGQNRVHPEARWPKPGTPFHTSPRAPSYWPTPAQTRLWPNLKRVHPILATHPPIGYPISIAPTRLWPGYSTSSPHAHASSRHRGTRRVIFAVDVVVRAAEL